MGAIVTLRWMLLSIWKGYYWMFCTPPQSMDKYAVFDYLTTSQHGMWYDLLITRTFSASQFSIEWLAIMPPIAVQSLSLWWYLSQLPVINTTPDKGTARPTFACKVHNVDNISRELKLLCTKIFLLEYNYVFSYVRQTTNYFRTSFRTFHTVP